jgi:hypothetical protein
MPSAERRGPPGLRPNRFPSDRKSSMRWTGARQRHHGGCTMARKRQAAQPIEPPAAARPSRPPPCRPPRSRRRRRPTPRSTRSRATSATSRAAAPRSVSTRTGPTTRCGFNSAPASPSTSRPTPCSTGTRWHPSIPRPTRWATPLRIERDVRSSVAGGSGRGGGSMPYAEAESRVRPPTGRAGGISLFPLIDCHRTRWIASPVHCLFPELLAG